MLIATNPGVQVRGLSARERLLGKLRSRAARPPRIFGAPVRTPPWQRLPPRPKTARPPNAWLDWKSGRLWVSGRGRLPPPIPGTTPRTPTAGLRRRPYHRSGFLPSTFTRGRLSRLSRLHNVAPVQTPGGGLGFVVTGGIALAAALAALGIGAAGGTWGGYKVRDVEAAYGAPSVLTPPILPPPAAPATLDQLTRGGAWTPELMAARSNQLAAQYLAGRRAAAAGAPTAGGELPIGWILAGVGALAALVLLKR